MKSVRSDSEEYTRQKLPEKKKENVPTKTVWQKMKVKPESQEPKIAPWILSAYLAYREPNERIQFILITAQYCIFSIAFKLLCNAVPPNMITMKNNWDNLRKFLRTVPSTQYGLNKYELFLVVVCGKKYRISQKAYLEDQVNLQTIVCFQPF